jgi:hypothetical protein
LESLALREGKTNRSIRMTLSLAFLAPDIVKAAVEGRLPLGCGPKRLVDTSDGVGPISGELSGSTGDLLQGSLDAPSRNAGLLDATPAHRQCSPD